MKKLNALPEWKRECEKDLPGKSAPRDPTSIFCIIAGKKGKGIDLKRILRFIIEEGREDLSEKRNVLDLGTTKSQIQSRDNSDSKLANQTRPNFRNRAFTMQKQSRLMKTIRAFEDM